MAPTAAAGSPPTVSRRRRARSAADGSIAAPSSSASGVRVVPDDALVIFTPSGRRGRFPEGTSVLDAARSLGVDIDSVCGGRGICGRCQGSQGLGAFPKHGVVSEPDHLSAFAALETTYRDEKGLAADPRLSGTAPAL